MFCFTEAAANERALGLFLPRLGPRDEAASAVPDPAEVKLAHPDLLVIIQMTPKLSKSSEIGTRRSRSAD